MEWCDKHNRKMLLSKYLDPKTGEERYWCPDCAKEKKDQFRRAVPDNEEILNALREIYKKIDKIEKDFEVFTRIFSDKQK